MCNYTKSIILFVFVIAVILQLNGQKNYSSQLNPKQYDKVVFLTTHNAFNCSADAFSFPNQDYTLAQQLTAEVRGFMLDVYDNGGELVLYHGYSILGYKPLSYELNQIKTFLDNNPNEIVSIILECYVTANKIESALSTSGLLSYAYIKTGKTWPTLQEMINSNKRLVVFSDKNDASVSQKWYHYIWNYAVETSFSVTDTMQFRSDYNRGNPANDLFILNHFMVTPGLGTGSKANAMIVNSNPFLANRITRCMTKTGKIPNFLTVDFHNVGNCLEEVYRLNGITNLYQEIKIENSLKVSPNPSLGIFTVVLPAWAYPPYSYKILTLSGICVLSGSSSEIKPTISLTHKIATGIYFLRITDVNDHYLTTKICFK